MKRFYGSAVFEDEEVSDSAYTKLIEIRAEEVRRIEYHNREFQMQIDELNSWLNNEINTIHSNANRQINEQYRLINSAYTKINQLNVALPALIIAIQAQFFLLLKVRRSQAENNAVANVRADTSSQINAQQQIIRNCYYEISHINAERNYAIAQAHRAYNIEYNIRLTRRDKDIAWSHADATDQIAAVIANRYYLPVFMLRCAKGPCEYCRAKYGTTGTQDELDKLDCIPPFHDDCRCWLEEVGYVVMSR